MESYFRSTSYALVVTAFLAIALTGSLDGVSIVLYSIAVGICFYRDVRGIERLRLREWTWRALSIGYVPFIFVDGALISNRVLALVHMTLFVSAAKLFQNKRDRDWVFLYLIAFFQMLLAAGLTFNATFVGSLAAFLFFFISTLAAFEIRRTRRQVVHSDEDFVTPLKPPKQVKYLAEDISRKTRTNRVQYLLGASFAQVVIVAVLTLPFFFLIPRLGGGGVASSFNNSESITGFSDRVELGEVAHIKKSPHVVMRVRLDRKPPRYLRWRGVALEQYDGRAWSVVHTPDSRRSSDTQDQVPHEGNDTDANFTRVHTFDKLPADRQSAIDQLIVLEPLTSDTLFAAPRAFRLRGAVATVIRDKYTGALSSLGTKGRTTYIVSSDVSTPSEQDLRLDAGTTNSERIKELYLRTPKLDPRISQLAHEITRNQPTLYDKAKAIENYLKTEFHYTLDLKGSEADPLSDFLFQTREGHCEYFATAMAIMLRTIGIPSRIVNGFQMGEYNNLNDMYTVRESDAHSWVEAYFPRSESWVEFDPTPSAGINDYSQPGLLARLRKYADAMEVFWLDYIVTLDSDEQASIMVDLQHRLLNVKDQLLAYYLGAKNWTRRMLGNLISDRRWNATDLLMIIGGLIIGAISVVAIYVLMASRKRRGLPDTGYGPWWHRIFILPLWRRRFARRDYRQSAVLFYEQMLAIARRAALIKQPDQTPVEFALASGLAPIREITAMYNRVRFGGAQLDEAETHRISALLDELKQEVRRKRFL
jgi:protein-glutamine gamma-glutamyltransferase